MISIIEKLPVVGKAGPKVREAYDSIHLLVKLKPLAIATFWSLAAWMCECLGFWIVLNTFGVKAPLLTASFIYALGTIIGAVSPGGLGLMEATMIGLLSAKAVMGAAVIADGALASAATMIIRP